MQYDVNGAISFTRHLADVYRHILECQECRTVTLEAELTFLDSYMYLHNVRLGNCIMIDNQIPEDALEAHLPPLTLQLLGENIIKHNVVNRNHPMTIFMYTEERGSTFSGVPIISRKVSHREMPITVRAIPLIRAVGTAVWTVWCTTSSSWLPNP